MDRRDKFEWSFILACLIISATCVVIITALALTLTNDLGRIPIHG